MSWAAANPIPILSLTLALALALTLRGARAEECELGGGADGTAAGGRAAR